MRSTHGRGVCIVAALALGACGANSPEPVPEDEPSLVGLWRDTCPRGNVKVIDLRADGSYIFYADPLGEPRSEMSRGEYTLADDTLTFEVDSVCGEVAGTYSWVREGEEVTFTLVEDACGGRVLAFDGYVYAPADFPLLTQSIAERGAAVERVARTYHEAWAAHDLDTIAALLADEATVTAPGRDALTTEEFLSEAGQLVGDPATGRGDPRIYLGVDQALVTYEAWGMDGGTRVDPVARADVLTMFDGAITRIDSLDRIDAVAQPDADWAAEIVDAYRQAWSSGDVDDVRRLYGPDAVRSEPLYFVDYEGPDAIADLATRWFDRHPDTVLTVVEPFVFGDGDERQTVAALFRLTDSSGCEIPVATRLDVDGTGAITAEQVFYDLAAIQSCGWRR